MQKRRSRLSLPGGGLGGTPNRFVEDALVVPMTRSILPESGRKLVSEKLPAVWGRLGASNPESLPCGAGDFPVGE